MTDGTLQRQAIRRSGRQLLRNCREKHRAFVYDRTRIALSHVSRYSLDLATTQGHIDNFIGVAQVPVGIDCARHIHGEHTTGDFLIPLTTTEGSLLARQAVGVVAASMCSGANWVRRSRQARRRRAQRAA